MWTKDEAEAIAGKIDIESSYINHSEVLVALGLPFEEQEDIIRGIPEAVTLSGVNYLYNQCPAGSEVRSVVLRRYLEIDTDISELSDFLNDWRLDVPEILVLRIKLQQLVTQKLGDINTIDEADELIDGLPDNCEARLLVVRRMVEIVAKELNQGVNVS